MTMASFLGIDLGTSAVKAVLLGPDGRLNASAARPLSTARPAPGLSEQDPADWYAAVDAAVAELRGAEGLGNVAGIGLSGQMHGAVLLDADGVAIRPAILWNDNRGAEEAERLAAAVPDIEALAGALPGPGLQAPKLMWLAAHEPAHLARARHVLAPKDALRFHLTGAAVTDPCDAAGTLLLDQAARRWSSALLAAAGIEAGLLPHIMEGPEVSGVLKPEIARRWGLAPGTVVATGAGDGAAGAIGLGAVRPGDAFISLGTSAQISVALDRYAPLAGRGLQCFAHGLPGLWYRAAALLNGASVLSYAAGLGGIRDLGAALAAVEARYDGPGPLFFLPYLSGERTPLQDPHARGVVFGLTPSTTPLDLVQAALEGLVHALMDGFDALGIGAADTPLGLVGGGAASPLLRRLLASGLNRPLATYHDAGHGPALGAARLARLAVTGESPSAVCTRPEIESLTLPEPVLTEGLIGRHGEFRALYAALKPRFAAAAH